MKYRISAKIEQPTANVALAWLLHQPGVSSVIAGARRPEQIRQTAQAADLELPSEVLGELVEATDEIKRTLGPNPDMWLSESPFR
jgi:aryl-alcohol dehydrogenase-like predicted oxidoreductase